MGGQASIGRTGPGVNPFLVPSFLSSFILFYFVLFYLFFYPLTPQSTSSSLFLIFPLRISPSWISWLADLPNLRSFIFFLSFDYPQLGLILTGSSSTYCTFSFRTAGNIQRTSRISQANVMVVRSQRCGSIKQVLLVNIPVLSISIIPAQTTVVQVGCPQN